MHLWYPLFLTKVTKDSLCFAVLQLLLIQTFLGLLWSFLSEKLGLLLFSNHLDLFQLYGLVLVCCFFF